MSNSLWPHGLQHARLPCPSPSPRTCLNSCPLCWWCHPTVLSSVIPFSSCLLAFPASGSFPMSQLFASGGQSVEASASGLPMNIQDRFPLELTDLISLQSKGLSKGLSKVFSNTTIQKHQFFGSNMYYLIYLHFLLIVLSLTGYMFHRGRYFSLLLLVLYLQRLQYSWHI